jgi:predicted NBD/HSP70 family sugar kinase
MEPLVSMKALRAYLHDATLPEDASAEAIAQAAAQGNPSALAAAHHLEHYLALGMISLTNIFNPAHIIIGGEMRAIAGVVLDDIRNAVKSEIISGLPAPGIHLSENGDFECAIGAAAIAHQQEFDQASVTLT